jgi:hypothetical protein
MMLRIMLLCAVSATMIIGPILYGDFKFVVMCNTYWIPYIEYQFAFRKGMLFCFSKTYDSSDHIKFGVLFTERFL